MDDGLTTGLAIAVAAVGYVVLQMYRGYRQSRTPFVITYHETGVPHQRGIVTAVHYEEARFATLEQAVTFTLDLVRKQYAVIGLTSEQAPERPGYSLEMVRDAAFKPTGQYRVQWRGDLAGMKPAELAIKLEAVQRGLKV